MTLVDGTAPVLTLQEGTGEAAVAAAVEMLSMTAPEDAKTKKGKKKKRARATTNAPTTVSSSSTSSENRVNRVAQGGFWMILATHVLHRLLAALDACDDDDDDHTKENISQVLAVLSYFLARILLPVQQQTPSVAVSTSIHLQTTHDKTMHKLLEKACSHAKAKSLLGRAILSITVGATTALDHLATADDSERSTLSMTCWVPATLALDMAVRLSHSCPKVYASISVESTPTTGTVSTPTAATTSPVTSSPATATTVAAAATTAASPASPSGPASPLASADASGISQRAVTFWNQSQARLEDMAMQGIMTDNNNNSNNEKMTDDKSNPRRMETVCQELCQTVLDMAQWEVPCLAALLGIISGNAVRGEQEEEEPEDDLSPPAKRAAGRRKSSRGVTTAGTASETQSLSHPGASGSVVHPLLGAFHDLVSEDDDMDGNDSNNDGSELRNLNSFKMDGRVAAKRWSSMALVWLMQGQRRVLEAMVGMLLRRGSWQESAWDAQGKNSTDDGGDKKRPAKAALTNSNNDINIPGNVALVALVTRLAGIVTETHTQSGSRAPSGALDAYVRAILPVYQATAEATTGTKATATKKASAKKPPKVAIPDLRDIATVVLYHLLQAHEDCLEMNFQERGGGNLAIRLVNDEDHSSVAGTDLGSDKQLRGYNPAMRPIVESLCRAASATANCAEKTQGHEHLRSIASTFVLQNIHRDAMSSHYPISNAEPAARQERPIDTQLVQFALAQFASCLEKSDSNRRGLADDPGRMTDSDEYDVGIIANRYDLLEPLPLPVLGQSLLAHASAARNGSGRGTKSTAASPQQPAALCTYAGLLQCADGESSKEPREDDFLTLFIRSAITSEATGDKKKSRAKKSRKHGKGPGHDTETPECARKLMLTLLFIVERSYGGLLEYKKPDAHILSAKTDKATKRTAPASKGKGSKRRKTNDGAADESGQTTERTRPKR